MSFLFAELICIALQFICFIPFYLIWRKDCKERGKENLAVPLSERFFVWAVACPMWAVPILQICK
jgi:hypothetical protein